MSEMVERVARALFEEAERQLRAAYPNRDPVQWGNCVAFDHDSHCAYARAAIASMREPTKEMVETGELTIFEDQARQAEFSMDLTRVGWRAMIDEALR